MLHFIGKINSHNVLDVVYLGMEVGSTDFDKDAEVASTSYNSSAGHRNPFEYHFGAEQN